MATITGHELGSSISPFLSPLQFLAPFCQTESLFKGHNQWKWNSNTHPPRSSRIKPHKSQNVPFSHPWFLGEKGYNFSIHFVQDCRSNWNLISEESGKQEKRTKINQTQPSTHMAKKLLSVCSVFWKQATVLGKYCRDFFKHIQRKLVLLCWWFNTCQPTFSN